jgi:multiple sugar transport system permease protein
MTETSTATADRPTRAAQPPTPVRSARRRRPIVYHALMLTAAFIWLVPIIWMFSLALTPNSVLRRTTTSLFPKAFTLENFSAVFKVGLMVRWFTNSLVVTTVATVLTVLFCAMAGYAFAKIAFPGRRLVFVFVIAGLMVPKEAMFVPLFLMFSEANLHNTYPGLFLPRIAAPLGVFLMTQFFSQVPREIEEAARVDGASRWRIFWSIMLPLARPALASLAIFTFVLTWNDYLWPLVSATQREMFTVTTGLASLQGNFAQAEELGSLMARGIVGCLPLLLFFLLFQRQLIRGITLTSGEK